MTVTGGHGYRQLVVQSGLLYTALAAAERNDRKVFKTNNETSNKYHTSVITNLYPSEIYKTINCILNDSYNNFWQKMHTGYTVNKR